MELAGRVALVTGAARRVGRAIALELGRRGAHLAVHFRGSESEAEETVQMLRGMGVEAHALPADLRDPAAIDGLFEAFDRRFDHLDVLVNSAASFRRMPFAETTAGDWDDALAVNLRAPFLLSQRAAERARRAPRREAPALIVNLGDRSGVGVWSGYAAHGVSKAGLLHLTKVAAVELAPEVRVNAIVPGAILPHAEGRPAGTARREASGRPAASGSPGADLKRPARRAHVRGHEEQRRRGPARSDGPAEIGAADAAFHALGQALPLQRTGSPEDVARTVVFLAENDFITGAVLPVDGGEHLLGGRPATAGTEG